MEVVWRWGWGAQILQTETDIYKAQKSSEPILHHQMWIGGTFLSTLSSQITSVRGSTLASAQGNLTATGSRHAAELHLTSSVHTAELHPTRSGHTAELHPTRSGHTVELHPTRSGHAAGLHPTSSGHAVALHSAVHTSSPLGECKRS